MRSLSSALAMVALAVTPITAFAQAPAPADAPAAAPAPASADAPAAAPAPAPAEAPVVAAPPAPPAAPIVVDVPPAAPAPVVVVAPPTDAVVITQVPPSRSSRIPAYAFMGGGAVGVIVGAVLGGLAAGQLSQVNQNTEAGSFDTSHGLAARQEEMAAGFLIGAGICVAAVGVEMYLSSK